MRRILAILVGILCLGFMGAAAWAEEEMASLERQFREVPTEARRSIGPLFFLHGDETKERLELELDKVAEGGNGCFTTESRPHPDWLGPGWFRDLKICLDAAKKRNLKMWIFDEKWFPSQAVAGMVPARYAAKQLDAASVDVEGPREWIGDGYGGERYIGAVAGRLTADGKIDGSTLIDLADHFVRDGRISWQAPAGKWRIMKFTHKQAEGLETEKYLTVDGASKDCVDWFLQTVYQPHYDHFKDDFGKTILGFFYDEPVTYGDWGTELNTVLAEWKVDWKKAYVAYKFELAGEEQTAAQYQYFDALAEAWGRTMYGGMTKWCEAHGVKSIGHFIEHWYGCLHRGCTAGNMMRLQKYSSMGAIDAVCTQFIPGRRESLDWPIWQTPKLASSITHAYGKPDDVTMVEIYGARGQDLTYPAMKWWADHMQLSGVNFLIPHSFNPRAPYDQDAPPYFYNGGFEPRWPMYRVLADYSARLSLMLTGGRHVCPVAILYCGMSRQVGKAVSPDQITTALQDAQVDCDWLPYEVFERDTVIKPRPAGASKIGGAEIQLRDERYRVLIVPPVEVIPYDTLAKVKEFFDRGGIVVSYGFLPSKSATIGKTSNDIAALCHTIWGDPIWSGDKKKPDLLKWKASAGNGHSYLFAPQLSTDVIASTLRALTDGDLQVLQGYPSDWLHILHRQKAGRDVFLVGNQNPQGEPRDFTFRVSARGEPECWDAMRNEITSVPYRRLDKNAVELTLTMEPLETVLLVFQPETSGRPARIGPNTKPLREPIVLKRIPAPHLDGPLPEFKRNPLTLSPVGAADPFLTGVTLPADVDPTKCRVYLEMEGLPDDSAAVTINGVKAGGVIGYPLRVNISSHLKPGENTIFVEPLAPRSARLVFYP